MDQRALKGQTLKKSKSSHIKHKEASSTVENNKNSIPKDYSNRFGKVLFHFICTLVYCAPKLYPLFVQSMQTNLQSLGIKTLHVVYGYLEVDQI